MLRYLRARCWDLKHAAAALRKTLRWREQEAIAKLSCLDPFIQTSFALGNMYMNGYDKEGHPIIVLGVHLKVRLRRVCCDRGRSRSA